MRYIITILLFICTSEAFAQKISISGFTVKREMPADVNDWKAGDVNAVARSSNPQGGEKEVRMIIQVKRGSSKVCGNDLQSASYENVTTKVISVRDIQSVLGDCRLQPGQYTLCIQFYNNEKYDISGEQCREFTVAEPVKQGNPTLTQNPSNKQTPKVYRKPNLIAPANNTKIGKEELRRPMKFIWSPVVPPPPPGDVIYTLRVYELYKGQQPAQAVKANQPIWEKEVKTTQAIWQIPAEYASAKDEKIFVWNVRATNLEGIGYGEHGGMTEPFAFMIMSNSCNTSIDILEFSCPKNGKYDFKIKITNNDQIARTLKTLQITEVNGVDIANVDPNPPYAQNSIVLNSNSNQTITGSFNYSGSQINCVKLYVNLSDGTSNDENDCRMTDTVCLKCICTSCDSIKITLGDSSLKLDGSIAEIGSTLGVSPKKVKKLTASIVYFSQVPESEDCMLCNTDSKSFGTFDNVTLNDSDFESLSSGYNREARWESTTDAGGVLNGNISFRINLPPVVKCCKQNIRLCIRYIVTLDDCTTCDKLVCYTTKR